MRRYLQGSQQPESNWITILKGNLAGSVVSWLNNIELEETRGLRIPHPSWREFANDLLNAYDHSDTVELARNELHCIKQTGAISGYIGAFNAIRFRIPLISNEEAFSAFVRGLKPDFKRHILLTQVRDLDTAMRMAERVGATQELLDTPNRRKGTDGGGGNQSKNRKGKNPKKGPRINAMDTDNRKPEPKPDQESNAALNRQRREGDRNRREKKNPRKNKDKNRRERKIVCHFCKKQGHMVQDCALMREAAKAHQERESRKN